MGLGPRSYPTTRQIIPASPSSSPWPYRRGPWQRASARSDCSIAHAPGCAARRGSVDLVDEVDLFSANSYEMSELDPK